MKAMPLESILYLNNLIHQLYLDDGHSNC